MVCVALFMQGSIKYRQKNNNPIREDEIKTLNGLILEIGFKFPSLWDSNFLNSLKIGGVSRATKIVEQELAAEKLLGLTSRRKGIKTHNKIMIIDGKNVITGSFNITKANGRKNAENLLVIKDKTLAAKYVENWKVHERHSEIYPERGK
jgi:phosphatidylserine/phosphatidylglycerophosphate/cardiolipin synthase-like enzyme